MKKNDVILICVLLVAAVAFGLVFFLRDGSASPVAVVSVDGTEVLRLPLADTPDSTVSLQERCGVPVSFEIRAHKIRFVNVTCPDHICENTGFLSRPQEMAVCLPNKTALIIAKGAGGQPPAG